jgi:hypothetical protein
MIERLVTVGNCVGCFKGSDLIATYKSGDGKDAQVLGEAHFIGAKTDGLQRIDLTDRISMDVGEDWQWNDVEKIVTAMELREQARSLLEIADYLDPVGGERCSLAEIEN